MGYPCNRLAAGGWHRAIGSRRMRFFRVFLPTPALDARRRDPPLGRLWLPDNTLCRLIIAVRIRLGHRLIDAAHGNRFGARRPCLGGIRSLDATAFLADAGFGKNASLEDEAADARAKLAPQRSSRCDILASGLPQMDGIEPSAAPDGCGFFEISLPTPAFGTRRGGYSSGGFGSPTAFLARLTIVAAGRIIDAALRG